MRDISEDAAQIADMINPVRGRFVEAFDTSEHIGGRLLRPASSGSFWPATQSDTAEDDPVPNIWRPSAAAISRSEEVLQQWLIDFLHDLEHRRLVLAWAASIAAPRKHGSFARFCKKSGRARSTANHRLLSAFSIVSALVHKNGKSLHAPDWHRVGQLARHSSTDLDKVAKDALPGKPSGDPSYWRSTGAVPVHHPELHEEPRRKAG